MEFPFKSAKVSALVHATEDERKVIAALRVLLPNDVGIKRTKLKGHHGNPIVSLEASIEQKRKLQELWRRIVEKLRAGEEIWRVVDDIIDKSCRLYLRFNKQQAYAGELALTDSGDAIHITLKVTAYPARKEVAAKLVKEFIIRQETSRVGSPIGLGGVDEVEK
jgi:RNA binding exosome subunit